MTKMQMKDIPDDYVVELARQWQRGELKICVVDALVLEGVPEKLAFRKVERLVEKGRLDYGTSPRCAWPVDPTPET